MADHRENDGLGDLGAESPGGLSDEQVESDTPLSSVTASTHDTSRSRYRMKELGTFAKRLEEAASRAFPVQGRARYKQVIAVLIQWGDDDLNVQPEIDRLRTIFEACYGFFTQRWKIPSASSHLKLMSMVLHFVEDYGSPDNLMIIYYCGHAEINDGCATWLCKQDPSSPFVNWTAIQTLFEETSSDVLFLLDSCATSGLATGGGQGIIETIAACGAEEWSPGPGRHLFTHALISVLEDWITRPSFSAAMLHSELLAAIKHEKPERRKWKDLQRMQDRRTPVYIFSASDPKVLSIELATRRTVNGRSSANFSRPAIPSSPPPPSTVFSQFDIYNPSNLIKTLKNGDLQIPHVLISVALDEDSAPDVEAWYRWIRQIPALAKYGVVEGVYKSHSTMLLISIPLLIWDMLPDDLAISFVAYVQSRNLLAAESVEDFQRLAGTKEATSSNTLETDASQTAASIEHHINYLKRLVQNPEPAPTPEPELGSATLIKIKTLPDPPLSERIQRAKTTEPHRRSAKVDGARFAAEMAKDLELHRRSAKIPSYFNALSETKINDILTEAKFAREEATRAWEELGRREKEERERVQLLKEGKPVFIGRTQVIATDSQSATPEKNSKAEAILGTLLGLSPRDAVKKHVRARSEPRNPTKSRNINGIPGRGMSFIDHKTKMLYGPLPLPKRKPVPVSVTQQNISKTDKEKKAEKERERQRDMVIKLEKERNKEREKKRPDPEVLRQIMSFQSRSLERFSTVTASTRTKEGSPLASPHVGTIPTYTFLHDEDGVVDSGAATAAAVVDEGRGLLKELDAWGEKLENTVTRRPLPLPPVVLMPNSNVPERKGSKLIKKGKEGRGGQEGKEKEEWGAGTGERGRGRTKRRIDAHSSGEIFDSL
ncbi:hypothetical protein G7Y89_g6555 [Cudoniella acicularis]|uniref:Uncharacterized protein n=1 Tax=Cudoniella acicularis TaxID=354080 RepID=A0A8H4RK87_9HELO|nr:hypothetical protein G7Y89_g6555 [Cudoniella acicularis]